MELVKPLLKEVEVFVSNFIQTKVPSEYIYHNLKHTQNVVNACREISDRYEISDEELEILELAAWFHDTGYDKGGLDHEERSCQYAEKFLQEKNYNAEKIQHIKDCIMATRVPQQPTNLIQAIISDADLSHLGKKSYWSSSGLLRQELTMAKNINMSEVQWVDFEIDFIAKHQFHTPVARELYGSRKEKNIRQLKKQKIRLRPQELIAVEDSALRKVTDFDNFNGKKKAKNIKDLDLGRGVETMYRTTYRTHVNLSSIADNKANIMLSINAIIVSITLSTLVPRWSEDPRFIVPTIILLAVCLIAIIFATLSTRPKITEGKFTREDIEKKKSNLLFFGNFYNMKLDDFQWGMKEMIKDSDFLYGSMTRDIYYLGIVLAKKYKYLSWCYGIFMYGLIITVIAFAVSFIIL